MSMSSPIRIMLEKTAIHLITSQCNSLVVKCSNSPVIRCTFVFLFSLFHFFVSSFEKWSSCLAHKHTHSFSLAPSFSLSHRCALFLSVAATRIHSHVINNKRMSVWVVWLRPASDCIKQNHWSILQHFLVFSLNTQSCCDAFWILSKLHWDSYVVLWPLAQ